MPDAVERLLAILARLRDPDTGCPWDLAQDFDSIAPYTLEEAYEVDDAIRRRDWPGLRDELGDLLLQVVYHARLAEEAGHFDFEAVAEGIAGKLVRRHPHVFGDAPAPAAEPGRGEGWEAHKAAERAARGERGALDDVPQALPALARALKLQGRAARLGFAWPDAHAALEKLEEEARELAAEVRAEQRARAQAELGDLLFAAVGLAHALALDPERALREANARFETRFRAMEARLRAAERLPETLGLDEWRALFHAVRAEEPPAC